MPLPHLHLGFMPLDLRADILAREAHNPTGHNPTGHSEKRSPASPSQMHECQQRNYVDIC